MCGKEMKEGQETLINFPYRKISETTTNVAAIQLCTHKALRSLSVLSQHTARQQHWRTDGHRRVQNSLMELSCS
jgi:hypothetical protein